MRPTAASTSLTIAFAGIGSETSGGSDIGWRWRQGRNLGPGMASPALRVIAQLYHNRR